MLAMRHRKFNPVNNATFRKVLKLVRRYPVLSNELHSVIAAPALKNI